MSYKTSMQLATYSLGGLILISIITCTSTIIMVKESDNTDIQTKSDMDSINLLEGETLLKIRAIGDRNTNKEKDTITKKE